MLKDLIGIIDSTEENEQLKEITRTRSLVALPMASRYRLVDFLLSNMVNSGIHNVGIVTLNHYNSLVEHLGSGKEWDLNRKRGGLLIFHPYGNDQSQDLYRGNVDAIESAMGFIKGCQEKYVLITASSMLYKLTFDKAFDKHLETGADITLFYSENQELTREEKRHSTLLDIDDEGCVTDIQINSSSSKLKNIYMNTCIIEKNLLEYLLEECISRGNYDFVKDVLLLKLKKLKIYGYSYSGYLAQMNSVKAYFDHNMELLNKNVREELFFNEGLIHTKVMDEPPAIYTEDAEIKNCMIADGCRIEGTVENSILFRRVKVGKGSIIKNCIIMQDTEIYENVTLENVIIDKNVIIRRNRKMIGQKSYPMVVAKGSVI